MPLRKPIARARGLPIVLTIGHSTRPLAEFIALLRAHAVSRVADVRTVPRSWHNPQFNKDTLPSALRKAGVGYSHLPGLGGLRHAQRDSINGGWRNASFRGYADYMQTPEFAAGLEELIRLAARDRIALMCAEAVPWRCHRSLIADALLVRGIRTEDIMSLTRRQVHTLTPFAKVRGTTITYPAGNVPLAPPQPPDKCPPARPSRKTAGAQPAGKKSRGRAPRHSRKTERAPARSDSGRLIRLPPKASRKNAGTESAPAHTNVPMATSKPVSPGGRKPVRTANQPPRPQSPLARSPAQAEEAIAGLRRGRERLKSRPTADNTDARASLI